MQLAKIDEFILKIGLLYVKIEIRDYNIYTGGIVMQVSYKGLWVKCAENEISKLKKEMQNLDKLRKELENEENEQRFDKAPWEE